MSESRHSSYPFLEFMRSRGFVGQELLLTEISRELKWGAFFARFSIKGFRGSGKTSIVEAIAAFLGREVLRSGGSELTSVAAAASLLEHLGNRILLVSDVSAIRSEVVEYLTVRSQPGEFPIGVAFELNDMELRSGNNHLFHIFPYSPDDLKEIARLYAIKQRLHLTESQIEMVVQHTALPTRPGTRIEDPYRQELMASRQPAAIISSLERLAEFPSETLDEETIAQELIKAPRAEEKPASSQQGTSERLMFAAQDPSDSSFRAMLMTMNGREFEEFVCSLLKRLAFQVTWASPGKDGGIDITAMSTDPLHGGKFLFQCKRYQEKSTVGRPVLQEFCGAAHSDKQHPRLVFVTTSSFTREAQGYASQIGMRLIDFSALKALSQRDEPTL